MAEYNFSYNLQKAMEKAYYIAEDLETRELQTFELALAILMDSECPIAQQYLENGLIVDADGMIDSMLNSPDVYEKVTGQKYPMNDESEETNDEKDISEEEEFSGESVESDDEGKTITQNLYILFNATTPKYETPKYINIQYSDNLSKAFEDAYVRCKNAGKDYIDSNNVLFSILCNEENSACILLKENEYDIEEFKNMLLYNSDIYETTDNTEIKIPKVLESCCTILNNKYSKGIKCEILKRDKEIFKAWSIFSKKTKRNCILVGDAGVGKTAIVEAITMQIVNGKCPKEFKNYNVVSLDLTSMVAGTKYRGEFENKVQSLIKFLERTPNVIIFVDEVHQIMGTGAAEGSGPDLSGSLKPILARDDVIFIGSTTNDEYERYFIKDPAFKRRFEKIVVKEPKLSEVKPMIKLRVENISNYHGIEISEETLDYIIITAKAMNYEANNPDLTVDLIDRSMAIAKMRKSKVLTRKDVDKVYSKNYENFSKIRKKDKLSTAYHEAGHTLMRLLAKEDVREDVKIVSIIPAEDYLGVTISEENDSCRPITRKAVLESASMSIAGRVAQEYVNKEWDFGASSDLVKATEIIRKMIVEMGMDTNIYTNISLYNYGDSHNMSPSAVEQVNKRIEEIMKEVYESTKLALNKNKKALDVIAYLLMERGIISSEEINESFKKEGIKLKG